MTRAEIRRCTTAEQLIALRSRAVNDQEFTEEAAARMVDYTPIVDECKARPELLIEMLFSVVDKQKKTVPFFLNEVQRDFVCQLNQAQQDYAAGRIHTISVLILKGRQQGFTTLITAYQLASAILHRNFEGLTVADDASNAQVIFDNKAKFIFDRLPLTAKPSTKYNNRRELRFEAINSYLAVDVATKDLGRSRTINFLHASECAFWRDGIANVQAGLGEALTRNCIKIYESTANGFNDYREMWQGGSHINVFYEWWRTPEYSIQPPAEWEPPRGEWIGERLAWLGAKGLTPGQLYWYWCKWESYIDKALIKQEYPCTPDEAFLSSGRPVFNVEAIARRMDEVKPPLRTIGFIPQYRDPETRDKIESWTQGGESIALYEEPQPNVPYVLGGDTAGEGSDAYTAFVLRNDTGEQVAALHMPLKSADCTPYVEQIYCLGMFYNKALIAPEINFNVQVVSELQRLKYPRIYVRQKFDDYRKPTETKYGWKTDSTSRDMIISLFAAVIEEHPEWIRDKELLRECLGFEYNEKGRPDARAGEHDDRIFAAMIAYKAREQQSYKTAVETKTVPMPKDIVEDYQKASEADKAMLRERFGGIPVPKKS